MSTSSIKRRIGRFHVVVVQWTSKKCTKKRDARAEHAQLFCCRRSLIQANDVGLQSSLKNLNLQYIPKYIYLRQHQNDILNQKPK